MNNMTLFKVGISIFALFSAAHLSLCQKGASISEVLDAMLHKVKHVIQQRSAEDEEDDQMHQRMWGATEHEIGDPDHFHASMEKKMKAAKSCHRKCGKNEECHKACPKPWQGFVDNCQKLQPMFTCHGGCHQNSVCHAKCPLPECPHMKRNVLEALSCHAKCGEDTDCHHKCPHPIKTLHHKCNAFGDVMSCHKQCAHGDLDCHHACPKMKKHWQMTMHPRKTAPLGVASEDATMHEYDVDATEHGLGDRDHFHASMKTKETDTSCHRECGKNEACHAACPKPWQGFMQTSIWGKHLSEAEMRISDVVV
jgi:hypothetical protein